MSKSTIASVLSAKRAALKELKAEIATLSLRAKEEKAVLRMERAKVVEAKRESAIAKAQARLEKLLAKKIAKEVGPVGAKAIKSNKRPSKGTVTVSV